MVTKRADQVMDSVAMLDKIETGLRSLLARRDQLKAEIQDIERLGWVEAKPHYRDGKYLYLIYPMVNGERKREYIGGDPEKIIEALARIDRKAQYDDLHKQLANVEYALGEVRSHLTRALGSAYSVTW